MQWMWDMKESEKDRERGQGGQQVIWPENLEG